MFYNQIYIAMTIRKSDHFGNRLEWSNSGKMVEQQLNVGTFIYSYRYMVIQRP